MPTFFTKHRNTSKNVCDVYLLYHITFSEVSLAHNNRHSNNNNLVFKTFNIAHKKYPDAKPIFHSNRGFQYTTKAFKKKLDNAGMTQSSIKNIFNHTLMAGDIKIFHFFICLLDKDQFSVPASFYIKNHWPVHFIFLHCNYHVFHPVFCSRSFYETVDLLGYQD